MVSSGRSRSGRRTSGWRASAPALAVGLALVAAACSSASKPVGTTTAPTDPDATASVPDSVLSAPSAQALAAIGARPGHLAIVDADGLAVTGPDGQDVRRVAPGAVTGEPTWTHQGQRLSWGRSTADGSEVDVYDLATGQSRASNLAGPAPFYLQWSPDDSTLAFLHLDPAGSGGVELGVVRPGSPPARIGVGNPLFLSWAPTRPVVAAHVSQRQVLTVPSPLPPAPPATPGGTAPGSTAPGSTAAGPASVIEPTGPFGPPAWVDDNTVLAATAQALVTANLQTGQQSVVVRLSGAVQFVLSPDRKRVAYRQQGEQGGKVSPASFSIGPTTTTTAQAPGGSGGPGGAGGSGGAGGGGGLRVVELATGAVTEVSQGSPLAFEWAPDSQHLAWLETTGTAQRPRARWSFWDGRTTSSSVAYQPSQAVQDGHVPFFDQFAQSTTGWSPDSAAFAFTGHPDGGPEGDGVWVQLVGRPGAPPVRVAQGQLVSWGP